ncbi:MAG: DUF1643 domain-containing protein [Anaerolineae bacterium]|nr:DUF1643 domain-containing protein [Anaerolineae bacterium]
MRSTAFFSPCHQYRYLLWREWDVASPSYALFIGLNPSTADETHDDPTVRRCIGFAKRWGYGAVCVTNLFALCATNPNVLTAHPTPVGEETNRWIIEAARHADVVIAAWGNHGSHLGRDQAVLALLPTRPHILQMNQGGQPAHPLYLPKTLRPGIWAM